MGSRTLSSSKLRNKKAQFFVLSAFAIISIIFFVSRWIEPFTIIDTSAIALTEEPFVFNNIVEKAQATVTSSKDCDDLKFNLEEYKNFAREFVSKKNYQLIFDYVVDCEGSSADVNFKNITLLSPRAVIQKSFVMTKSF